MSAIPGTARRLGLIVLVLSSCQFVRPTVELPANAPLTPAMCGGWPADPPLAFAGWAAPDSLGIPMPLPGGGNPVFVLVTRDAIDQPSLGAPTVFHGRGLCVLMPDGIIGVTTVADDWTLR